MSEKNTLKHRISRRVSHRQNKLFLPFSHRQTHDMRPQRRKCCYAALDLGTNNCRLLIARPKKNGHFQVVDAFSRVVRLGEGLYMHKKISDAAMDRAVEALKVCRDKLQKKEIIGQRLITTQTCRLAENSASFIERVHQEVQLELEIVSQEEEAKLGVIGCTNLVEKDAKAVLLFDIGGGSCEISLLDMTLPLGQTLAENIVSWISLPIGIITLAESFEHCSSSQEGFFAMKNHVSQYLADFTYQKKIKPFTEDRFFLERDFYLLGTSGTVTTLAGLYLELDSYEREKVDGLWLQKEEINAMMQRLLSFNAKEKVAQPCIGKERAQYIVAGCAILEAIREAWPAQRLRVADRGLREGILIELMLKDNLFKR